MQILHYFLGNCFLEKESTVLPASHIVACDFMMGCRPLFESLIMTYPTTFATTYPLFDAFLVNDATYLSKVFFKLWWDLDEYLYGEDSE